MNMCLNVYLLGCILYGTAWTWVAISFPMLGKFSSISSANIFSDPFSSETPMIWEVSEPVLVYFDSFFFILLHNSSFHHSFSSLICSASFTLLLILSSVSFLSVQVFFITVCLLFSSSQSLLNISCIFSVCASILPLRFRITFAVILWILFQVGCLFPLHLFCLVSLYIAPSSVPYFLSSLFFFLMGGTVFLSCWLFGLRCSALEFAGRGWSRVLALRWEPLGELTPINVAWGLRSSVSPWDGLGVPTTGAQAWSWPGNHDATG